MLRDLFNGMLVFVKKRKTQVKPVVSEGTVSVDCI